MVSLLAPNATAAERALEGALLSQIDLSSVGPLRNPFACQADVLPFLAWELAISHWDTTWTVEHKREAVAGAVAFHKIKGTRAAVEQVLDRFHPLLSLTEWWEANPPRSPHTFEVRAPSEIGADFLTPETSEAIIRDVAAAKPLRAHFDFVQTFDARASLYMAGAGISGSLFRTDATAEHDTSRDWSAVLQTEDGEPIYLPDGSDVLETA